MSWLIKQGHWHQTAWNSRMPGFRERSTLQNIWEMKSRNWWEIIIFLVFGRPSFSIMTALSIPKRPLIKVPLQTRFVFWNKPHFWASSSEISQQTRSKLRFSDRRRYMKWRFSCLFPKGKWVQSSSKTSTQECTSFWARVLIHQS